MKNLIENGTNDFLNEHEKIKELNVVLKLSLVVLLALLIWQSCIYHNYKKLSESKAERDLQSINGYKDLIETLK